MALEPVWRLQGQELQPLNRLRKNAETCSSGAKALLKAWNFLSELKLRPPKNRPSVRRLRLKATRIPIARFKSDGSLLGAAPAQSSSFVVVAPASRRLLGFCRCSSGGPHPLECKGGCSPFPIQPQRDTRTRVPRDNVCRSWLQDPTSSNGYDVGVEEYVRQRRFSVPAQLQPCRKAQKSVRHLADEGFPSRRQKSCSGQGF